MKWVGGKTGVLLGYLVAAVALCPSLARAAAPVLHYDVDYAVELQPQTGKAHVTMTFKGSTLPSRVTFSIDPDRHRDFKGDGKLEVGKETVTWYPPNDSGRLDFDFLVDHSLKSGAYDSRMTADWAVFRGDRMIPSARVLAARNLIARTTLTFSLPTDWSVLTPYPERGKHHFEIEDPERRFDRPTGWILAGRIGSRHETIAGISTQVGAPAGDAARRQDTLAFLNYNLPQLVKTFPEFPKRLLVVRAGEPMFRGGLSGPASLFLHSDRPLISENRTSTLLHELVHVAMGIHGDGESDWIVEGFAEYYSLEVLRRSGGISERRFEDAAKRQADWGKRATNLFVANSSGATTARAVTVLMAADAEIRAATAGRASLDEVARSMAAQRGEVSLALLQSSAAKVAGKPLRSLERSRLQPPK